MNKITTISLAGLVFNIEEVAYDKLYTYLQSIKSHFAEHEHKNEIISDIENIIALRFLENGGQEKLVTLKQVEELIFSLGKIEENTIHSSLKASLGIHHRRKLMRDPDDQIIAGVASGIAAYFDIEIWTVRLIFVISLFIGGGGILAYIILWLIMPEAKTVIDRLEMRGSPINVSSLSHQYYTQKKRRTLASEALSTKKYSLVKRLGKILAKIFRVFVMILLKLIGVLLTIASLAGMIALTFIMLNLLFNIHSPNFEFPLAQVLTPALYYLVIILTYCITIVPLIFFLLIALGISRRKNTISSKTGLGLSIFWIIAVMSGGVFAIGYGPEYWDSIQSLPQFQTITETKPLANFTHLDLHGPYKVIISQGKTMTDYQVVANGIPADIEEAQLSVSNGTLSLVSSTFHRICFLCVSASNPTITIVMPKLDSINAQGKLSITINQMKIDSLDMVLKGSSQIDATLNVNHEAQIDMTKKAQVNIRGTTDTLKIGADSNAYFFGKDFISNTATVDAIDYARVNVNAQNQLTVNGDQESTVVYQGNPSLQKNLYHNSIVKPASLAIPEENQFNSSYYSSWSREPF